MQHIDVLRQPALTGFRCVMSPRNWAAGVVAVICCVALGQVPAPEAGVLLAKHAELKDKLDQNAYRRPLVLESRETGSEVSGDVYAVINFPFQDVSGALSKPSNWCEMLILHINTKYCRSDLLGTMPSLKVHVGRKTPQELQDTFALDFSMKVNPGAQGYFFTQLNADRGPMGTSNYRIELKAAPLPGGKTFMHLRYSYGYGMAARLAMQGYLATIGNGKNGFTRTGSGANDGYVGGMRGAVERNTMRYYLAIEAYLAVPRMQEARLERLNYWFDATEQYAQQLREVDKPAYLAMKKLEYQRQSISPPV